MFKFITGRPLWMNFLFSVVLVIVVVILFLTSLKWCTSHGETIQVPQVTGLSYNDAVALLEKNGFEPATQPDSVYFDSLPPLSVTKQFPEADAVVKRNRKVYLTLNRAVPPTIEMPRLIGQSYRSAEVSLRQYGLKLGDTSFEVDFAKNSVLKQLYNGAPIEPGVKIQMGSTIDLVLGTGVSGFEFTVPDLVGLTYDDARASLQAYGLIVGALTTEPDVRDTANAFVYRQEPDRIGNGGRFNKIRQGQAVDVFLSVDRRLRTTDSAKAVMPPANDY